MNDDDAVRLDTRLSGQLKRYHTWPIIGQQTIAEHCWQLLRIYCYVSDKIDPHMIYQIAFHDIGETYTGDVPYPVKSDNPQLKALMDMMEQRSVCLQFDYWDAFKQICLTDDDKKLFKHIELVEMAEFGLDQMCLGNQYAFIIADRCLRKVYQTEPCIRLVLYVIKRINLFHKQHNSEPAGSLGPWWSTTKWHDLLEHKEEEVHGSE